MPQRHQPALLERARTTAARLVFTNLTLGYRAAIALTPKYHPWRTLAKSTFDAMQEMTDSTLRPRNRTGAVSSVVPRERAPRRRVALATAVSYLMLAQAIPAMPAVVLVDVPKVYPFQSLGITAEPVIAPRMRIDFSRAVPNEMGSKLVREEEAPR